MAKLGPMSSSVNRRRYVSPSREAAAARTRERVVRAARELFAASGWEGTPIVEVARRAQVSVDTVYATVGRKPVLLRQVIDTVLGEGRGPVPAERRRYVEDILAADTAAEKITAYAEGLGRVMPEVAPLLLALRDAGTTDPDCAAAWHEVVERRAGNMRSFAADLRGTGELRVDLDDSTVADLVWATNSPEYYTLLTSRGWTAQRYVEHLSDLWCRLLITERRPRRRSR
jgi:AcrR family transcriptional regulator